ncbi:hypothetical protein KKF34_02540 [Myxococcota bacterium]|nr:hypothetical protein [Myxococcota bacterium]MBU1380650.1 hypothetical protein [Myxococcota bacterium]MBU1495741.1 hypothetical protein [Myxococcota bacterium]
MSNTTRHFKEIRTWTPSGLQSRDLDSILQPVEKSGRVDLPAWLRSGGNHEVHDVEIRPIEDVIPSVSLNEMLMNELEKKELSQKEKLPEVIEQFEIPDAKPDKSKEGRMTREVSLSRNLMEEEQRLRKLREENEIFWEELMKKEEDLRVQWDRAKDEGYRVGMEEGIARYEIEIEKIRASLGSGLERMTTKVREIKENYMNVVTDLSLMIVSKVLGNSAADNREMVFKYIKEALSYIDDEEKIVLKLNPDDYEYLKKSHSHFIDDFNSYRGYRVEATGEIMFGGCILEYSGGRIDNTLDTRFEQIKKSLESENENV